jgi:hypothetical protein
LCLVQIRFYMVCTKCFMEILAKINVWHIYVLQLNWGMWKAGFTHGNQLAGG